MSAFGIDLGTSNIKIYNSSTDKIFNQKNIVAIANRNQLFSLGNEAFEAYGKAPANIKVSFPMSYGVIADFNNMQTILQVFIEHCAKGNVTKALDLQRGDNILLTGGPINGQSGNTNTIKVETI